MNLTYEFKHDFKKKHPIDFRILGIQKVGMFYVEITRERVKLRYYGKDSKLIASYFRAHSSTKEIKKYIYEDIFERLEK